MARRSSYASVLAGAASAPSPPAHQPPARSGFLSHLAGQNPQPGSSAQNYPSSFSHHLSRHSEPAGALAIAESWERGQLPPYSTSLGHDGFVIGGMNDARLHEFFVPSYLRGCKHVERLEEKYKARKAAERDGRLARSSNGSLSTSASSHNLHKMVPSHRGMTYDIQESHPYARPEDNVSPLPTRWSHTDKFAGLEIYSDGTEVKFTGASKATQDEAATIRSDHPMPKECGIYYFEVTVMGKGKEGLIGVGFSSQKAALSRLPGWEPDSWAYHGDDGFSFCQTASGKSYGPKFGATDVIGCGVNFRTGSAFFTKNGVHLGLAFRELKGLPAIYPSVGMKKPGEHIRVNFGQAPFVFDIDGMVAKEKQALQEEISKADASRIHEHRNESSLFQGLVAQYLAHDGYIDTAKAFSEEARATSKLLSGEGSVSKELDYKEDLDAIHRQRIRAAILEGDMDRALKYTNTYYPSVLRENENIYFKLRCRKFIEMIRKCTDLQPPSLAKAHRRPSSTSGLSFGSINGKLAANGHARNGYARQDDFADVFDGHHMEVDDASPIDGRSMHMDTEEGDDVFGGKRQSLQSENEFDLMNAALTYGQELQSEFRDDPRREVKQALEDTFALIAYPDARESSLAPLMEVDGRVPVAEELNSAILVSLGKSSNAALERLVQQTEVLVGDLSHDGAIGSAINVRRDYMR